MCIGGHCSRCGSHVWQELSIPFRARLTSVVFSFSAWERCQSHRLASSFDSVDLSLSTSLTPHCWCVAIQPSLRSCAQAVAGSRLRAASRAEVQLFLASILCLMPACSHCVLGGFDSAGSSRILSATIRVPGWLCLVAGSTSNGALAWKRISRHSLSNAYAHSFLSLLCCRHCQWLDC